jgi:LPXTG-motif cell wall-anchored protein
MDLPESMRPSSDARILAWVGTLATLTAGALWVNRRRR